MKRVFVVVAVLLSAVGVTLLAQHRPSTATGEFVAGRDERAILRAIYLYSYTFDGRDLDGFVSLFTEDALWESYNPGEVTPTVSLHGAEQLRKVISNQMSGQIAQGIQSRHYQTDTLLTRLSEDRVHAITMLMVTWQQGTGQGFIVHTGFYRDEFVRQGSDWKLAKRQAYLDEPKS